MYRSRHNILNDITDIETKERYISALGNNGGVWCVEGDDDDVTSTDITGILPYTYDVNEKVSFLLIMHNFIRVYYRDVYTPIAQLTTDPLKTCLDMGILK